MGLPRDGHWLRLEDLGIEGKRASTRMSRKRRHRGRDLLFCCDWGIGRGALDIYCGDDDWGGCDRGYGDLLLRRLADL